MTRLLDATISAVLYIYNCLCRLCFAIFYSPPSKLDPTSHPNAEPDIERGYHQVSRATRVYSVLDISAKHVSNNAPSDAASPKPKRVRHRRRRSTRWFPNILKNRATQADIVALVRQAFEDSDDEYEARAVFDRQSAWGTIKSLVIQNPDADDLPTTPTSQCWTEALPPYTPPPPPLAFARSSLSLPRKLRCTPSFQFNTPLFPSTITSQNLKMSDTTQSLPALLVSQTHLALPCIPLSYSAPSLSTASVDVRLSGTMTDTDTDSGLGLDVPEEIDADWSDVLSLDAYVV